MRNNSKLVIFDMDGVLVDIDSSWHHVHHKLNVDSTKNLQKYLAAEIDYSEFMRRDIRLWGRCHIDDIRNMFSNVPLMNGAKATAQELKNRGYKLAILSAGISLLAERVQKELEIDYVFANKLSIDKDGYLTGEGEAMVDLLSKEISLIKLIEYAGVNANQCVALGDSEFDVPMFKCVGLSIAFNSSDDSTKKAADKIVEIKDLRAILPLLG